MLELTSSLKNGCEFEGNGLLPFEERNPFLVVRLIRDIEIASQLCREGGTGI